MAFALVKDCALYYELRGEGAAVVYVHGGFASLDTTLNELTPYNWGWQNDFASEFKFITYDRRGCARSTSPETGYDLLTQANDLAGLLDHLQVTDAHIMGSSAGGPISVVLAATQPERVRSLILVGTALDLFPQGEPGSDTVREHLVILKQKGGEAAFDQRPTPVEVTFGELWDEPEAIARGIQGQYLERQQNWRAKAQHLPKSQRLHYYTTELRSMEAYITTNLRPYAEAVTAPTYVIQGTNDKMVPLRDAQELARAIPNSQMEVVEGGPHSLMIRHADARQKVIGFIKSVEAGLAI